MRFQRLLVGALGAALLGALPVALASSAAQAGAALPTGSYWHRQPPLSGYGYDRYGSDDQFKA